MIPFTAMVLSCNDQVAQKWSQKQFKSGTKSIKVNNHTTVAKIVWGGAGWRSGCSRAFHQCGPGSIPSRVRVVCEFGSRSILARAGFLRALRFPPAPKIVSSFHISLKIHFWRRPLNLVHNALLGRAWLFAECYK